MPLGEPPTYTVKQLELKAQQFLQQQFGDIVTVPVDVELLLEKIEGVDLDFGPALRQNHGLDGMVLRDPQTAELFVIIDEWLAEHRLNRYRMTVAEELAHILLHRPIIEQITEPRHFRELQQHYRWHEMERNAKRFAAAILMPGNLVARKARSTYQQLVHKAGFDNVNAVKKYLVSLLAKDFVVSVQSMDFRLREWPMQVFTRVEQAMQDGLDYWD